MLLALPRCSPLLDSRVLGCRAGLGLRGCHGGRSATWRPLGLLLLLHCELLLECPFFDCQLLQVALCCFQLLLRT